MLTGVGMMECFHFNEYLNTLNHKVIDLQAQDIQLSVKVQDALAQCSPYSKYNQSSKTCLFSFASELQC